MTACVEVVVAQVLDREFSPKYGLKVAPEGWVTESGLCSQIKKRQRLDFAFDVLRLLRKEAPEWMVLVVEPQYRADGARIGPYSALREDSAEWLVSVCTKIRALLDREIADVTGRLSPMGDTPLPKVTSARPSEAAPIALDQDCPSWCTEHRWSDGSEGHAAVHEASTETDAFTVSATRWVLATPPVEDSVVLLTGGCYEMNSANEVEQLVAALVKAAGQVWPSEGPSGVGSTNPSENRLVLAERAVLDAVRDWVDGDGRGIAVENAYAALWAARNEAAGRTST